MCAFQGVLFLISTCPQPTIFLHSGKDGKSQKPLEMNGREYEERLREARETGDDAPTTSQEGEGA